METGASAQRWSIAIRAFALVSSLLLTRRAAALDFGNTLTFGELHERMQPAKLYNSESVSGTLDISDALSWNADFSATHYLANATSSAFAMWRLATGLSWDVDDHLSLDLEGTWSPGSSYTFDDGAGLQSYHASSLGLSLDATYDLAPHDTLIDYELLLNLSTAHYNSVESSLDEAESAPSSAEIFQARISAGTAITVRDTRLELDAMYYVYAGSSHAAGAPVPNPLLGDVGASVPIEPLRSALRADLTQKLGALRLSTYVQGGTYVNAGGEGLLAGFKVTWVISSTTRLSIAGSYQRISYTGSDPLTIPSLSLGLRVYL